MPQSIRRSVESPDWRWLAASALGLALSACGEPFFALQDQPSEGGGAAGSGGAAVASSAAGAAGGAIFNARGGAALGLAAGGRAAVGALAGAGGVGGADAAVGALAGVGGVSGAGAGGANTISPAGGAGGAGGGNPATLDVIDDVEGAFPALPERAGRNGGWYMVHDDSFGSANLERAAALNPEMTSSHYAARFDGSGFTDWGAQLGVSLKSSATGYDASQYCGVRFLAKGASASWTLLISDRQSVPEGGVCGAWNTEPCYQFVGKTFDVGPEWRAIEIRFDELSPLLNPNSSRKLDVAAIYDIVFNFYDCKGRAFELWVDDLAFIEKAGTGCPLSN